MMELLQPVAQGLRRQRMVSTLKFDISRLRRLSRGTLELYGQKGVRLVSSSLDGLVNSFLRQNWLVLEYSTSGYRTHSWVAWQPLFNTPILISLPPSSYTIVYLGMA